jgi:hypothetical protein
LLSLREMLEFCLVLKAFWNIVVRSERGDWKVLVSKAVMLTLTTKTRISVYKHTPKTKVRKKKAKAQVCGGPRKTTLSQINVCNKPVPVMSEPSSSKQKKKKRIYNIVEKNRNKETHLDHRCIVVDMREKKKAHRENPEGRSQQKEIRHVSAVSIVQSPSLSSPSRSEPHPIIETKTSPNKRRRHVSRIQCPLFCIATSLCKCSTGR